jgi:RNA polymerase sigma-70 factor (ECF subfamily)
MTTESPVVEAAWRSHRPYLVNLAYQMLGDVGEAEDVAQEAFLRLSRAELEEIDDVRGWLTVVAGRLCLDQLRSARARHEHAGHPTVFDDRPSREPEPADRVTLDDQVSGALFQMLSQLSPGERVAFVLHDVFKVPFDEIAETVGRPVGTCRQLARRARAKVRDAGAGRTDISQAEHQQVVERFISACATGNLEALTAVLDPAVWGVATLLGDPPPAPQTNYGPDAVAANLLLYLGPGATLVGAIGQPVLLGYAQRRLFAVLLLTVRDGLVVKIEATADPSAR